MNALVSQPSYNRNQELKQWISLRYGRGVKLTKALYSPDTKNNIAVYLTNKIQVTDTMWDRFKEAIKKVEADEVKTNKLESELIKWNPSAVDLRLANLIYSYNYSNCGDLHKKNFEINYNVLLSRRTSGVKTVNKLHAVMKKVKSLKAEKHEWYIACQNSFN